MKFPLDRNYFEITKIINSQSLSLQDCTINQNDSCETAYMTAFTFYSLFMSCKSFVNVACVLHSDEVRSCNKFFS